MLQLIQDAKFNGHENLGVYSIGQFVMLCEKLMFAFCYGVRCLVASQFAR
jgi:hypothetical protein